MNNSVLMLAKRIEDCDQVLNVYVEPDLPDILVDQPRIKQVLVNLLTNASKFTREGGSIAVRTAMGSYGHLHITIKDSGQGMDNEEIQIVLERFGRANSSAGHEGTGLGLPLSRELILAHDGQMKIESQPGLATTITLSLPVSGRSNTATDGDGIPNRDI
ncbi:MAG: ATP-binding protein [Rhodospirillaceae bacterium]